MENFQTGLLLMVVGMVTVFAILLIVIYFGKLLIALVNKYAPEEVIVPKQRAASPAPIQPNIVAAITAAVNVVTHNKGKIVKIEKQN